MDFLHYTGSKWEKTKALCRRDGEPIFREVTKDSFETDHFCCGRNGCTWPDYFNNQNDIRLQLSENIIPTPTFYHPKSNDKSRSTDDQQRF
jgi:hypothetical protein